MRHDQLGSGGEEFRNKTGLTSLPHDLFYNWKQPPVLAAKGLQASFLYARWWLSDGKSVSALKQTMEESGLPAMDILKAVHLGKKLLYETATRKNLHAVVMKVFREHDASFEDPASTSSTRKAYEVYDAVSTSVFGIYDIVTSKKFQKGVRSLKSFSLPSHGFSLGPPPLPTAEMVFSPSALRIKDELLALPQTFGRVYTELECQQTDDRLFCFECAILDNHVFSAFEVLQRTGQFYEEAYGDDFLIPFNNTWTNASSYNRKYQRAYKNAQDSAEAYGSVDSGMASTWEDWVAYGEGLIVHRNRSIDELVDALDYWFQGNFTGKVPANASLLLPSSFQEVLELPFQADCTTADFLWSKQLRSPFYGLLPFFGMLVSYEFLKLTVLEMPLVLELLAYSFILASGFLSYLVVVYEYNPLCFPQIPTYLIADFLSWLEDTLFVSCSCGWFPFLSKQCEQQTCYACQTNEQGSNYYTCAEEATGMSALGQFWHLAFFLRWQASAFVKQIASIQVFPFTFLSEVEGLSDLLQQAI